MDLQLDYSDMGALKGYEPEFDYRNQGYKPFKDQMENGTGPVGSNPLCLRCKSYYKRLYDRGITQQFVDEENQFREDGTPVAEPFLLPYCSGSYADRVEEYSPEDFESEEDYYLATTMLDPVQWARAELNWFPRWYQRDMLRCSSQFRATRAGRRVGKTEGMAVYVLWKAWSNSNQNILIIAPYQAQVARFFEILRLLLGQSVSVSGSIDKNRQQPHEMISFKNGSKIKGFSSGARSGAKSDQIRGQDANLIVLDEADYLADADLETISAILASEEHVELMCSSTPTGIRQKLHTWCTQKEEHFKEFWFISAESPSWTKKAEDFFKSNYSEGGYSREFLAEFGTEMMGDFQTRDIENSIQSYKLSDCVPDVNRRYVIGDDWNKNTGTHIVVVEQRWDPSKQAKYKLVAKEVIRRSEFTQHEAVQKIMDLDKQWKPTHIYVDAGYGDVQVEMLWKYDKDHPNKQTNYRRRVVPVEMGGNTIMKNPLSGEDEKKPTKPFFVNLLVAQMENGRVEIPKEEDTTTRILPEELEIANIGLAQQMREFKVTKYSPQGRPTYSQDFEHTLTAFMCAIGGFILEFSDLRNVKHSHQLRSTGQPGQGPVTARMDPKLKRADLAAQRRRLEPQDRLQKMDARQVRIEPEKPDSKREVLRNIYGEDPGPDTVPDSEVIEDHIELYNSGKAPMRLMQGRSGLSKRHRRSGGYRRSMF
jgi:replicative DNA helicase